jgi:hypothetical protein
MKQGLLVTRVMLVSCLADSSNPEDEGDNFL